MTHSADTDRLLDGAGLRPTPNRRLVLRAIADAGHPLSLTELETRLETVDKSSVSRTLGSLLDAGLIHSMEDGRGVTCYELCHAPGHRHTASDMHAHFYCEECHTTFCLDDVHAPEPALPEGFEARSLNYMFKGFCPECSRRRHEED